MPLAGIVVLVELVAAVDVVVVSTVGVVVVVVGSGEIADPQQTI